LRSAKPVTLHMLPLLSHTEPMTEVPHTEVSKVFRLFSRIDELKRTASECNYKEDSRYVQRCEGIVTKIKTIEQKLQSNIKECVLVIRSSECDSERLAEICKECEKEVNEAYEEVKEMKYQKSLEKKRKEEEVHRAVPQ